MKKGLITVVLPCYNHENYIRQSIESVLAQTWQNIELLLLDNGSTDGSWEIMQEYADRATVIRLAENDINEGRKAFRAATHGEYFAIMTSDDIWLPDKLEKQFRFLECHSEYDACFSYTEYYDETFTFLDEELSKIFRTPNRSAAEWLHHFFYEGNCLCCPSAFLRTEAYYEIWEKDVAYWQNYDWFAWIRLLLGGKQFYIIPEVLVKMRKHPNAVTFSNAAAVRGASEMCSIRRELIEQIPDALFRAAFSHGFIHPDAATHTELLCEKIIMLMKYSAEHILMEPLALDFLYNHYPEPGVQEELKATYGMDRSFFNNYCSNSTFINVINSLNMAQKELASLKEKYEAPANLENYRIYPILSSGFEELRSKLLTAEYPGSLSCQNILVKEYVEILKIMTETKASLSDFFRVFPENELEKIIVQCTTSKEIKASELITDMLKIQNYLECINRLFC